MGSVRRVPSTKLNSIYLTRICGWGKEMMDGTAVEIDALHGNIAAEDIFCHLRLFSASDGVDVLQWGGCSSWRCKYGATLIGNEWSWLV